MSTEPTEKELWDAMCGAVLEPDVDDLIDAVNRAFLKDKLVNAVFRRSPPFDRLTKE